MTNIWENFAERGFMRNYNTKQHAQILLPARHTVAKNIVGPSPCKQFHQHIHIYNTHYTVSSCGFYQTHFVFVILRLDLISTVCILQE